MHWKGWQVQLRLEAAAHEELQLRRARVLAPVQDWSPQQRAANRVGCCSQAPPEYMVPGSGCLAAIRGGNQRLFTPPTITGCVQWWQAQGHPCVLQCQFLVAVCMEAPYAELQEDCSMQDTEELSRDAT